MDIERVAGREIEHPHGVLIPILECNLSRLSGTVPVLWPQTQILLCLLSAGECYLLLASLLACSDERNFALSCNCQ